LRTAAALFVAIREHKKEEDTEAESKVRLQGNKNKVIVKNEYCNATTDYRYDMIFKTWMELRMGR
jgi:hypothetical protein